MLLSASGVVKAAENKEDWDEPVFIKGADLEGQDLQQTENDQALMITMKLIMLTSMM